MPSHSAPKHSISLLIASDHAGFELKEKLKAQLTLVDGQKIEWQDLGPSDSARVDYPDYADRVAKRVSQGGARGVLICGSGQGMAIRANRYQTVRAGLVWNEESAKLARSHNDINIVCLGSRSMDLKMATSLVRSFLTTAFEGGRHADRVVKLGKAPDQGG